MVNSKKDAVEAVAAVKYPRVGKRGVGLARAQEYGFGFDNYVANVNKKTTVIAQNEHMDAINNLEEILSVQRIGGSIICPYDLSGSMGKPGRYEDNDKSGHCDSIRLSGRDLRSPIGFSLDTLFLGTMCREQLSRLRGKLR